jgi:acetyltransferase
MATDELLERRGTLAELAPETVEALNAVLPPHWSHGNPVDVLGDAGPDRLAKALDIVISDRNVDAALVVLTPQAMTEPTATAELVAESAAKTHKPVLAAWMGGRHVAAGREILAHAGLATYDSPDRAVRAFAYLDAYRRNRQVLYETTRLVPLDKWLDARLAREQIDQLLAEGRETLTEIESKALLSSYGIHNTVPLPARTSLEAIRIAGRVGYPVVMKIHSPQILHKTEVHGVVTDLSSDERVRRVFQEMVARARKMRPDADVQGVTIQPMISSAEGIELIVGAKTDPVFGAVMMIGAGGITAEVYRDRALELPPLNERLARRMLESLRIRPLLEGFRGRSPVDRKRLVEVLMRVSYLIADNPSIAELDVNPLLVTPEGVTALDARVILHRKAAQEKPRPYSHLAICPYPDEYVRREILRDGANVLLRPIQPEDEAMWHQLLARCSARSLWLRFHYVFKESTHEMATRFCFIDYDRTMAIVAEIEVGDERQFVGVGRLAGDADHHHAEYAVLVADAWQGRGLGNLLTDYCLEICRTWGIDRVTAETTADNQRMQTILSKRGFKRKECAANEVLFQVDLGRPTLGSEPCDSPHTVPPPRPQAAPRCEPV